MIQLNEGIDYLLIMDIPAFQGVHESGVEEVTRHIFHIEHTAELAVFIMRRIRKFRDENPVRRIDPIRRDNAKSCNRVVQLTILSGKTIQVTSELVNEIVIFLATT